MKFIATLFMSLFCLVSSAQVDPALAKEYYKKGDFEKALVLYKKLLVTSLAIKTNPNAIRAIPINIHL